MLPSPPPLVSRIHEGLILSNRNTRTLLDKLVRVALFDRQTVEVRGPGHEQE
jgi:hypothetical protein